jgi:hypothetical protein
MADEVIPPNPGNDRPAYLEGTTGLTVEWVGSRVRMHMVPESELESLATGGIASSLSLTFFGICFGALVSCASILYTGGLTDAVTIATYRMLTVLFVILTACFAMGAAIAIYRQRQKLHELKSRPSV